MSRFPALLTAVVAILGWSAGLAGAAPTPPKVLAPAPPPVPAVPPPTASHLNPNAPVPTNPPEKIAPPAQLRTSPHPALTGAVPQRPAR